MLDNITLGQYYPADSLVHRLDPRTKILLLVALIVAIFLSVPYLQSRAKRARTHKHPQHTSSRGGDHNA